MTDLRSGSRLLDATLERLRWLVAFDSTNPPRKPGALVAEFVQELTRRGLDVHLSDHDDGCMSVFVRRGHADVLLTAHLDTVPVAPGWTRDPFALAVEGERAYGLGACDVKGGAAAMLAAALATDAPCALLFTTDEEAGQATCVRQFLARKRPFRLAVVAEPTRARAVLAHRGVATGTMTFEGNAAHSSVARPESATHALVTWARRALDLDEQIGMRLNIGRIEGGEKPNVVAARAEARFGVRSPPDVRPREMLARFAALTERGRFELRFEGPPLPADEQAGARAAAEVVRLELPDGPAVDFWTEASLFSEAGVPAVVLGPGDVAQAHGPDEWVALAELDAAARTYLSILEAAS
jgi:acetylornithine deacetylase